MAPTPSGPEALVAARGEWASGSPAQLWPRVSPSWKLLSIVPPPPLLSEAVSCPLPTSSPALSRFWFSGLSQTPLGLSLGLCLPASPPVSPLPVSTLCPGPHSGCSRRTMSSAEAWQPGEPSGRPGLWSWRGTWRPFGSSWGSSVLSSRTADGSGHAPSVNSVNRTSGSASSWPRWDGPDPGSLGRSGRYLGPGGSGCTGLGVAAWAS